MHTIIKNFINSTLVLKILFVVALFFLILISSINYRHSNDVSNASKWVIYTYKVQMDLQKLHFHIKDAESNFRAYYNTKDSTYLKNYSNSKNLIQKALNKIKHSISDNEIQKNNLRKLNILILIRLSFYDNLIASIENKSANSIISSDILQRGKNQHIKIDEKIYQMINLEKQLLISRKLTFEDKTYTTPLFTLLLLFFSLFIFTFSYIKINKDFLILKNANQNLLIAYESMSQAETISGFSTWYWDLELNKLHYSDNMYELLGMPANSFEANVENFVNMVHPDDKERIAEAAKKVLIDQEATPQNFRVIRKDGEVRYFKSKGKTIIDSKGKKIIIGVTRDVTEQYLNNAALEERNFELEQTNAELQNFNQVASHDLQEPLRKIQIFISRITPHDMDLMSFTGKDYINKIKLACNRMRTLIDDLLLFSQTNKSDKLFIKTNLNGLLDNAKQELSIDIKEKNAIIESKKLPTTNVIPFQIQQLFTNLIHNFLKYSQPNKQPILKITCNKVSAESIGLLQNTATNKKYYELTFTDNGLGFEQEYADSIFSMFKRLHAVEDFPGTGIGLAICKKITENHFGTIKAKGEVNVGASFYIYLPV